MYGGTSLRYDKWHLSENVQKLFLCDSRKFQAQLIYMLYFQHNREANYLFLPNGISEKDIEQITAVQPNTEKRNGNLYENWQPKNQAVHDIFDCIKMGLACFEIAARIYRKDRFKFGEAKVLNKNTIPQKRPENKRKKPVARKPIRRYY